MNDEATQNESTDAGSVPVPQPKDAVEPPRTESPPTSPPKPAHLGAPSSVLRPKSDPSLEQACAEARKMNRSVSIVLSNPDDIPDVQRLMEGHNRKFIVKVSKRQGRRVLIRSL